MIAVSRKLAPETFIELTVYSFGTRAVSKPIKVGSTEVGGKVSCAKEANDVTPIKKKRIETLDKICCIMKYSVNP